MSVTQPVAGEPVLDALDGEAVRRWCTTALERLRAVADELNRLNVYPVKDSDTGVNLVTTMQHLCKGLPDGGELRDVLPAMSRAALMGAHGNSGTILSQLLRGVAEAGADLDVIEARALAGGLRHGAEFAYRAVPAPVEGTILTVARLAAEAAEAAVAGGADLAAAATAAADGARTALAHTPEQLPMLAEAGVVDAGGLGWCVMLDALVQVVTGRPADDRAGEGAGDRRADRVGRLEGDPAAGPAADGDGTGGGGSDPATAEPDPIVARAVGRPAPRETGSEGFDYEVQYLLDAGDDAVEGLRDRLGGLGDSVVIAGGGGLWNVHVHVNDVGAAIEAGIEAGRPHRITVTRFADQAGADRAGPAGAERAGAADAAGSDAAPRRVLAVVDGPGLVELVTAAGARAVQLTGLIEVLRGLPAGDVTLLPNLPDAAGVIGDVVAAARREGRTVAVVPTRSVVQGLAALAVHDPGRPFGDDVIHMASAAAGTRTAEVVVGAGGDVSGLVDGTVVATGADSFSVAAELLDRLLIGGGDLVTLVAGADADGLGARLRDYVEATRPAVEVHLHRGGQRHPLLVAGVE